MTEGIRGRKTTIHKETKTKGGMVTVRLPRDLHQRLAVHCEQLNVSMNVLMTSLALLEIDKEVLTLDYVIKAKSFQKSTKKHETPSKN